MCRTVTVVHVGRRATSCGMCSASLASVRFIYLPAKGTHPDPRPRFCKSECLKAWMTAYEARRSRKAAASRPHHAYNSNR